MTNNIATAIAPPSKGTANKKALPTSETPTLPRETVTIEGTNPMAQITDLQKLAITKGAYGDNQGGSSLTERHSDHHHHHHHGSDPLYDIVDGATGGCN